jgi:hypothetical protein
MERANTYRWFNDDSSRDIYPPKDYAHHGRIFAATLRAALAMQGSASPADALVKALAPNPELVEIWAEHEIGRSFTEEKRIVHPEVGVIEVHCQFLLDPDQQQSLLVFTATPGSESHDKLRLLSVIGSQVLNPGH